MLNKISTGLAALAVIGTVVVAASPASAQRWHGPRGWHGGGWHHGGWHHRDGGWHHRGWNRGAVIGGLAAGAIVGSALAARPSYGYPAYTYGEPIYDGTVGAGSSEDEAYCSARFKSYDPRSGTYLGYDGERHACP